MQNRLLLIPLALLLILSIVAIGCQGEEETQPPPTDGGTVPPQNEILQIGSTLSLQTPDGLQVQKWLELFANLINDGGGWEIGGKTYDVEFIIYDDENNPDKSRIAAERLILEDGVKYIICQIGGTPPVATLPVSEPNHVILLGDGMGDELCSTDYHYFYKASPAMFNGGCSAAFILDHIANGAETAVAIGEDSEMGHMLNGLLSGNFEYYGIEFLDDLYFSPETTDWGPVATKAKSLNPDIVMSSAFGDQLVSLICALHDVGYEGIVDGFNLSAALVDQVNARIGPDYLEGAVIIMASPRYCNTDPEMVSLMEAFEEEYGGWDETGLGWTRPWFLFEKAVNETQSLDVDVLTDWLGNMQVPVMTIHGLLQLVARPDVGNNRTVEACCEMYIGRVHNGVVEPWLTATLDVAYAETIAQLSPEAIAAFEAYWDEFGYPIQ